VKGKKKAALLVLAFAAVLFVASVSAAEEGEEVVILEPEIVTGSRIYTSLEEIPAPTYVIDREEIERSGARELNEILAKIPGIYTPSRNAKSQQVDIKIRGLATELLVLVDGAPYHTGTYISPGAATDLRSIPLEEIERIEIVKGAGSALYGSMAAAGVINIITRKMEGSGISILGETGTNDWKKGSISGWTTEGDFGVRIWYSKSEEGETPLSVYNPSGRPASANDGVVDKSLEYDEESAGLKLQKGPLTFNASWGEYESRWTYWQALNRQENEFSRFNLKWEEGPNRFMVYHHKHERDQWSTFGKSIYDNKAWGAEFSQRTTWGDSLVSWGTAFRKEDISYDEGIPVSRERTNYAPFLEVSRPVGDLLLNLGLRYEIWDQNDEDYEEIIPKLSLLYQTLEGSIWYLSAGRFFAMPSVYQLFGSPVYGIKPNYDLKPEKGYSYEFGVKDTDESGPWNVGLFYMTMDDKIRWKASSFFESRYENVDDYRAWGIEASKTWTLNELWDLSLGATWMRAEEKTETSSTWTRSTVPEWDVNATLAYGRGPWAGELTVNYFGNRNEGNVESDVTTVDALLEYRFDASTLRLSVYNLFDEEYWQTEASDVYYYGPERRVYLTLERIF